MSPRLKPLLLPQLVEDRRRQESLSELEGDVSQGFAMINSSSSDLTTPVTPTFSTRCHARGSSSTSSLDAPLTSSDCPSSPAQPIHKTGNPQLPDVQEEDLSERDESEDELDSIDYDDLYDCLCDEPCLHRDADLVHSATDLFYTHTRDIDFDVDFLSDNDFDSSPRSRKPRAGADSPFSGLTQRFGSRFPTLNKWKSARQSNATNSPISDFGFDHFRPSISSRAASSRSSSISGSARYPPDRSNEPPLPPTPAMSLYESRESISAPAPIDVAKANGEAGLWLERERALATTPLLPLPPSRNGSYPSLVVASQPSPLESPTVASSSTVEAQSPTVLSPSLSSRPSVTSIRRMATSIEVPNMPEPDAWSDRLGHANFTIAPLPYYPESETSASLSQLRSDWDAARINYTKHLVRTGEHYGTTSKTYALTEAKWAEIEGQWKLMHDQLVDKVYANGPMDGMSRSEGCVTTIVPRMDTEGKFPGRGDEDIVGPMVREATMTYYDGSEKKSPSFWRTFAGKVGLKRQVSAINLRS